MAATYRLSGWRRLLNSLVRILLHVGLAPRHIYLLTVRGRLDGRELATFEEFIDPQIPIPLDVQQVHGITDVMVRGQPTVEQVIPYFTEFLGDFDTILLAHNALFDLSFLAMALARLGIAYPPHYVCDTMDIARRLYPIWSSHRLEHVATRLNAANRAKHRALSDARLVKDVFLAMLRRTPALTKISELMRVSQPLTFADAPVSAIEPPAGFEALSLAMTERCAIMIVYEHGWHRPQARLITPRLVLEVRGVTYVIVHCHVSDAERTFRLDRIREWWLNAEDARRSGRTLPRRRP
jgi:DNA polymerase III epsilon subunit family exonuclease